MLNNCSDAPPTDIEYKFDEPDDSETTQPNNGIKFGPYVFG